MKTNVYNILWADDDVDSLKDHYEERFNDNDVKIVEIAHDGKELEDKLSKSIHMIDAVIVDANFNYTKTSPDSKLDERNVTGLEYAHSLYVHKFNRSIPFFLFTQRIDGMLHEKMDEKPEFNDDFKRHRNWFRKNDDDELSEMFDAIKSEVDKRNSSNFIIRNRYEYELNAAHMIKGAYDLVFEFLVSDLDDALEEMVEPFVRGRRILEKIFALCEEWKLIPPISDDTNGTANYFLYNNYSPKQSDEKRNKFYEMKEIIMPKPLAQSLSYIIKITQDGAHSKGKLKLNVDKYFEKTKDTLLLRSVFFILIDIIKWFVLTLMKYKNKEVNESILWEKCK